jgi:hypothetical protein
MIPRPIDGHALADHIQKLPMGLVVRRIAE